MALKKIKPTTPGQRHKIVVTNDDITATKPEKSLVFGFGKSGGRNNTGKMTMRYIGGGHKKLRHCENHRVRPEPQFAHRSGVLR